VEVEAAAGLPKPGEEWLTVEVSSQEPNGRASRPAARLVVCEGTANTAEIGLDQPRTNIGRVVDVYRSEGLHRRNGLAFVEDTEVNRSVSREHAHIVFDKVSGDYRLFNDRWYPRGGAPQAECGTWIVRAGMSQEVHRDSRGIKLEPGDEIHFGRAVVRFEMDS
jgi:pSer/pThr/pTyr-binding forkhead associated (FHA) protein